MAAAQISGDRLCATRALEGSNTSGLRLACRWPGALRQIRENADVDRLGVGKKWATRQQAFAAPSRTEVRNRYARRRHSTWRGVADGRLHRDLSAIDRRSNREEARHAAPHRPAQRS